MTPTLTFIIVLLIGIGVGIVAQGMASASWLARRVITGPAGSSRSGIAVSHPKRDAGGLQRRSHSGADLRGRVILAISEGLSTREAARRFRIGI